MRHFVPCGTAFSAVFLALRHLSPCRFSLSSYVRLLQHQRCCSSVCQSVGAQVEALQARLSAVTSSTTLASQLQDTQVPAADLPLTRPPCRATWSPSIESTTALAICRKRVTGVAHSQMAAGVLAHVSRLPSASRRAAPAAFAWGKSLHAVARRADRSSAGWLAAQAGVVHATSAPSVLQWSLPCCRKMHSGALEICYSGLVRPLRMCRSCSGKVIGDLGADSLYAG